MPLAISSYSFHRLGHGREERPDLHRLVDRCAEYGVEGLELLGLHFPETAPAALGALKRHAFRQGIALVAVSAHHNFVQPDPERRRQEVEKLCGWIDVAHELGAPAVRAFGGRWQTAPSFEAFMAARGEEPPLPGREDADAFAWSAEAFRESVAHAERRGVTLLLENHWGLTGSAEGVLRILRDTASPWLLAVLDTGNFNFRPDPYAEMALLAPHVGMVHAKTYAGGGLFYTADLDYARIARILREAGFRGYVSLEFEGRAEPEAGIPAGLEQIRRGFAG